MNNRDKVKTIVDYIATLSGPDVAMKAFEENDVSPLVNSGKMPLEALITILKDLTYASKSNQMNFPKMQHDVVTGLVTEETSIDIIDNLKGKMIGPAYLGNEALQVFEEYDTHKFFEEVEAIKNAGMRI